MQALLKIGMLFLLTSSLSFGSVQPAPSKVKIGIIYSGDSYPIGHAQEKGYFKAQGIEVEIVNFLSVVARNQALMSGALDGATGDLVSAALMRQSGGTFKITALTLGDQSELRFCGLVVSNPEHYKTPQDLIGKTVAISPNTIIEYLHDRMLQAAGIDPKKVPTTNVANMPLRMTMLQQKQLDAALLPEPLASMAVRQGGKILLDGRGLPYAHAILLFSQDSLQKKTDVIAKFHRALFQGIREINLHAENYRSAVASWCRVPQAAEDTGFLYRFAENQLPTESLHQDVQKWLQEKGTLKTPITYAEWMDDRFLEKTAPHATTN